MPLCVCVYHSFEIFVLLAGIKCKIIFLSFQKKMLSRAKKNQHYANMSKHHGWQLTIRKIQKKNGRWNVMSRNIIPNVRLNVYILFVKVESLIFFAIVMEKHKQDCYFHQDWSISPSRISSSRFGKRFQHATSSNLH